MTPLGFIVSAPFIPALARRVGGARLAILCSVLAALTLIAIGWTQEVWAWMPLRFLLGFFANPLYVISETWLMSITPAPRRGRIMGLYSSIVRVALPSDRCRSACRHRGLAALYDRHRRLPSLRPDRACCRAAPA
jgi:MFS family permease